MTDVRSDPAPADHPAPLTRAPAQRALSSFLFASRWLQAPLYVGLIVAQLFYVVTFLQELWLHVIDPIAIAPLFRGEYSKPISEADMMLAVLGLVDVVMVANLLIMVIVGGFETFVSRINLKGHPDQPEWLSHVNANVLKVKLAMAIIGISSIHLLKSFVDIDEAYAKHGGQATQMLIMQTSIHFAFILSALGLAWIDRLSQKPKPGPVEVQRAA